MSDLYWLTDEQMARLELYFPKSHGKPRVDDRRVLSGIVFVNRNGLRWCDAPKEYGSYKTLYNRWKPWGERGVFVRMMEGLAAASATPKTIMIDATYLKAHRTASSLRVKRGPWAPDRTHQRGHEHQAARRHRRRLVQGRPSDKGHNALHSGPKISDHARQIRQAPLPKPEPYRDYVPSSEGLAPRRHPLRPMPDRLLLRCGPRRYRHLLAMINES
jgi:transposase